MWLECCLHGEVQRIVILRDFAAVRFASVIAAAAAVDAFDGRFFAERTLKAEFDDGSVAPSLPSEHDTLRQDRFGFGEMAQAYRDSHRTLSLAAAEGAPYIGCGPCVRAAHQPAAMRTRRALHLLHLSACEPATVRIRCALHRLLGVRSGRGALRLLLARDACRR